ncbi:MAG: hypothetical protein VR71_02270 [Roseovarius sp. BRH_c41]|uniref:hypothetical protein n=1 Tax=Roseovarius sp. BRH_c41 TaxID=1629709 RepID=UPI0005F258D3|nr:hypothetical protein [Roseovarius sp. BRH_c41]KJS45255.1 MAG: hypothetical protein VR71_02270 [Roseovarius sp. BRH_c41]
MSDIVTQIKEQIDITQIALSTAEGRVELDTRLNAALAEIQDEHLRTVAYEMLKSWRRSLFNDENPPHVYHSSAKVQQMLNTIVPSPEEIVTWIKAADGRTYDDFAQEITKRMLERVAAVAH